MSFHAAKVQKGIESEFTIVNKEKQEVDFRLNPAQVHFLAQMELYQDIIVLKARKMGFSSVILGLEVLKFIFGQNERMVSMSFDSSASVKQLERAKHFLRSFEYKNGVKLPLKYNSRSELVYEGKSEDGKTFLNTLRIGTAKSTSFGRGDDITFLHITEAAHCPDMEALLSGVGEACIPGAHKIFETTANGFNDFKDFWDKAELGQNGYKALFYGPEWEYGKEYIERKRASLGRVGMQEYPRTPEEAFLTSGDCYFDAVMLGDMLQKARDPIAFQFQV
jgi:hypothetical protein